MSFIGGKLKLKGGEPLNVAGGVKKKKKKKSEDSQAVAEVAAAEASGSSDLKKVLHGYEIQPPSEVEDRRTEAEKKYDEQRRKIEEEQLRKFAKKSHRDRVKDFNEYLSNLTEHHDIPRVGPG